VVKAVLLNSTDKFTAVGGAYLLPKGANNTNAAIWASVSTVDNDQHLFYQVPDEGLYQFWVVEGATNNLGRAARATDYGIFWRARAVIDRPGRPRRSFGRGVGVAETGSGPSVRGMSHVAQRHRNAWASNRRGFHVMPGGRLGQLSAVLVGPRRAVGQRLAWLQQGRDLGLGPAGQVPFGQPGDDAVAEAAPGPGGPS
jgi:hypothetical protein